jgi:hypothetical protein
METIARSAREEKISSGEYPRLQASRIVSASRAQVMAIFGHPLSGHRHETTH